MRCSLLWIIDRWFMKSHSSNCLLITTWFAQQPQLLHQLWTGSPRLFRLSSCYDFNWSVKNMWQIWSVVVQRERINVRNGMRISFFGMDNISKRENTLSTWYPAALNDHWCQIILTMFSLWTTTLSGALNISLWRLIYFPWPIRISNKLLIIHLNIIGIEFL